MYQVVNRYFTNAKQTTYFGKTYDSKFEASYGLELEEKKQKGQIKDFEIHKEMKLQVNNHPVCSYFIDFVVYHLDGSIEYVETKGWPTAVWRLKWKIFEALYSGLPDVKLTVVRQMQISGRPWNPFKAKKCLAKK